VSLTPEQRVLRARTAAYAQWSREPDPSTRLAPARKAFLARFEREVDAAHPDLDPKTRARMVEQARKQYFAALALKSSKARAAARERKGGDGHVSTT
jgi:hypothetical protein